MRAGFVKGVGQGLVGAVAAPVSGGLDLFSSAIEGLDASKERLLGRPRAGTLLARRRLPRVIGGEAKLQPFIRDGSETAVSRRQPPPSCPQTICVAGHRCWCC